MESQRAETIAEDLKNLACISCTQGWIERHDGLTDPIQDIKDCADLGLITQKLRDRLINEVQDIKNEI